MPYEFTKQGLEVQESVRRFMDQTIMPNEETYNAQLAEVGLDGYPPVLDKLKAAAQERGLWNLFLPHLRPGNPGTPLSNLDYAPISEMLGKVSFASEVLNPGGTFVAKVFQSGADAALMSELKRDYASVRHVKPASSRSDSSERYVLAMGFRGVSVDRA